MSNKAWVTLATNDSYCLGALVLAHSLRRVNSLYPAVVLITPSVTDAMRDRLSAVFAEVITVDILDSRDSAHLALLQRPELGITFTKIHCWNLTQYEKCVFLDADALVVQNSDELFEREELSAAPDVGWPDCFNSGVFVFTPSTETYDKLIKFAQECGSFDGGDQGLLNSFFSDWAHADINKHLPFLYNVTSAAFYSYLPALKHYGQGLKIIHFIGTAKPWLQRFDWGSGSVDAPDHLRGLLQIWWDLFIAQVHPQLEDSMTGVAGGMARATGAGGELARRQGWEAGHIDYLGADSFDNIWAKISQTLQGAPAKEPSPPKGPSPPREQPQPAPAPVEVPKEAAAATPQPVVPAAVAPAPAPVAEAPVPIASAPIAAAPAPVPVASAPSPVAPAAVAAAPVLVAAAPAPAAAAPAPVASAPAPVPAPVEVASAPVAAAPLAAPAPAPVPAAPAAAEAPIAAAPAPAPANPVAPAAPVAAPQAKVEAAAASAPASPKEEPKTEAPVTPKATLPATPTTPPVAAAPASPAAAAPASPAPVAPVTPQKAGADASLTDSPPLANTPSKESPPPVPAAKCPNRACSIM